MFEFDAVSPSVITAEPAVGGDSESSCALVIGPPVAPTVRSTVTVTPATVVVLEETGRGAVPAALAGRYPFRAPCDKGPEGCATTILAKSQPVDGGQLIWTKLGRRHAGAWATFGAGAQAFMPAG